MEEFAERLPRATMRQLNMANSVAKRVFRHRAIRHLIVVIALSMMTLLTFSRVLSNNFVYFDDQQYITENPHMQSGLTMENIRWAFTSTEFSNWFPMTWLSHLLDAQVFGLDPHRHHLSSVLLHIFVAVLLFSVLHAMTGNLWPSACVAALFAIHPLHMESVAWVAERKDLLAAFFGVLGFAAYTHYVRHPGLNRYLPIVACLVLGLMAKPVLVTFPFVLLLLDAWPFGRWYQGGNGGAEVRKLELKRTTIRLLAEKVPLFALVAVSSVITLRVQAAGEALMFAGMSSLDIRLKKAIISYLRYLGKVFWPLDLSVYYPYRMPGDSIGFAIAAGVIILGVTGLLLLGRKRFPYLSVGWFWYLGTLVPMIGFVQVGKQGMADRYTYLPLIGVFIGLAWGFANLATKYRRGLRVACIFAAIVFPALIALSFARAGDWKSTVSLFSQAVRVDPGNADAHAILGIGLTQEGRIDEANDHFLTALQLDARLPEVNMWLGLNLLRRGERAAAIRSFQKEIAIVPRNLWAHFYLASELEAAGRRREAIQQYREILRYDTQNADFRTRIGVLLAAEGDQPAALWYFKDALRLNPYDALAIAKVREALGAQPRSVEVELPRPWGATK